MVHVRLAPVTSLRVVTMYTQGGIHSPVERVRCEARQKVLPRAMCLTS